MSVSYFQEYIDLSIKNQELTKELITANEKYTKLLKESGYFIEWSVWWRDRFVSNQALVTYLLSEIELLRLRVGLCPTQACFARPVNDLSAR